MGRRGIETLFSYSLNCIYRENRFKVFLKAGGPELWRLTVIEVRMNLCVGSALTSCVTLAIGCFASSVKLSSWWFYRILDTEASFKMANVLHRLCIRAWILKGDSRFDMSSGLGMFLVDFHKSSIKEVSNCQEYATEKGQCHHFLMGVGKQTVLEENESGPQITLHHKN